MDARSVIPGYEITATISNQGAQAVVYQAKQLSVANLAFAIKIYRTRVRTEQDRIGFLHEVKALRELAGHHNVVRLADADIVDGVAYLVMELCKGSLADQLRNHGPLPEQQVVDVARRVCGALTAAHSRGILHRDLKPSNLLITTFDDVVVADFGIAALNGTGTGAGAGNRSAGTPGYLAPELLAGGRPSVQSDVYALGATLHTLLHGSPPAPGQHVTDLGVSQPLQQAINQARQPDPTRRFATMADFAQALAAADAEPATWVGSMTIVDTTPPAPADDLEERWLTGVDLTQNPQLRPSVIVQEPSSTVPTVGWWATGLAAGLALLLAQLTVPRLLGYVAVAVVAGVGGYALLNPRVRRFRRLTGTVLATELLALAATTGYFAMAEPPRQLPATLAGLAGGSLAIASGCRLLNSWQVARARRQRARFDHYWGIARRAEAAFENSGRPPSWLSRLLALPATRLYRFDAGPLEYAAACGSRVVVFAVVRWHHGRYEPMPNSPYVKRNEQPYRQGAADMHAIVKELPRLAEYLGSYHQNLRVLVVITRDGVSGDGVMTSDNQAIPGVVFTTPETVTDRVGAYLAKDGYHIDIPLTQALLRLSEIDRTG